MPRGPIRQGRREVYASHLGLEAAGGAGSEAQHLEPPPGCLLSAWRGLTLLPPLPDRWAPPLQPQPPHPPPLRSSSGGSNKHQKEPSFLARRECGGKAGGWLR